jgi:hypothetical protein
MFRFKIDQLRRESVPNLPRFSLTFISAHSSARRIAFVSDAVAYRFSEITL